MDKILFLSLCIIFFYWGYYDFDTIKNKTVADDDKFEKNYSKITKFRSIILMTVSLMAFLIATLNIILEYFRNYNNQF